MHDSPSILWVPCLIVVDVVVVVWAATYGSSLDTPLARQLASSPTLTPLPVDSRSDILETCARMNLVVYDNLCRISSTTSLNQITIVTIQSPTVLILRESHHPLSHHNYGAS